MVQARGWISPAKGEYSSSAPNGEEEEEEEEEEVMETGVEAEGASEDDDDDDEEEDDEDELEGGDWSVTVFITGVRGDDESATNNGDVDVDVDVVDAVPGADIVLRVWLGLCSPASLLRLGVGTELSALPCGR